LILFTCYGLIAPRNGTVRVVLFISALSIAGAIFLILEMNTPLIGIIKVSSVPLHRALEMLGK
jgi:membrane-bound ClpP family serine protease